jgi:molybdenum cofactor cytidylyltransferase
VSVAAIILAAGSSSRLGQPKQLLEIAGEKLLDRAIEAATTAGCFPVVVVLGAHVEKIVSESCAAGVEVITNENWRRGIGTSIRSGMRHLIDSQPSLEAAVLLACDQPRVNAGTIAALMAKWDNSNKPIVASRYANTLGIPALFDRSCFESLTALPDDSGAKALIESNRNGVAEIEFSDGAIDIDTPADLKRLRI